MLATVQDQQQNQRASGEAGGNGKRQNDGKEREEMEILCNDHSSSEGRQEKELQDAVPEEHEESKNHVYGHFSRPPEIVTTPISSST